MDVRPSPATHRFGRVLLLLAGVFVVSTVGFMVLSDLPADDAVYLTVATMTTVGYGDIHPQSVVGKVLALGAAGLYMSVSPAEASPAPQWPGWR